MDEPTTIKDAELHELELGLGHMSPGERMIYATAFAFAWGTRYEEAKELGRIVSLPALACGSASAAAATVRIFRIAVEQLPASDPARPFLDDMLTGAAS